MEGLLEDGVERPSRIPRDRPESTRTRPIAAWRLDSQPAANPDFAADGTAMADREASGIADEGAGEAAVEPAESSGTGSLSRNV